VGSYSSRALRCIVLAVVAAALGIAADGTAASTVGNSFPPQLVGTWTRTITKADITRSHLVPAEAEHARPGLMLRLIVKTNGAAEMKPSHENGPNRFQGRLAPVGSDLVHVAGIPLDVPNVYRWKASHRTLTFTKVSDRDITGLRDAWFVGTWHRS